MSTDDQLAELRTWLFATRETCPASHLYLLLDDGCPVALDHPLHPQALAKRAVPRERMRVGPEPLAPADDWRPLLVQFFRTGESGYVDDELIELSFECAIERCSSINGAYVAGWIASDLSTEAVAEQLTRLGDVFDVSAGRRRRIPLHEPHRLALRLADSASAAQLGKHLAGIHLWAFVDTVGRLRATRWPHGAPADESLAVHMSLAQCRMQARVPMARRVLMGLRKAGINLPAEPESAIDSLLVKAADFGLVHAEDVVFFALNCLSLAPRWYEHPTAVALIRNTVNDQVPLAGVFGELDDAVLEDIGAFGRGEG